MFKFSESQILQFSSAHFRHLLFLFVDPIGQSFIEQLLLLSNSYGSRHFLQIFDDSHSIHLGGQS